MQHQTRIYLVEHKIKIQRIQRFEVRLVPDLKGLSYKDRLRELNLNPGDETDI